MQETSVIYLLEGSSETTCEAPLKMDEDIVHLGKKLLNYIDSLD
jgi:hypothetical protein